MKRWGVRRILCAAYTDSDFDQIAAISHHMVFNSVGQYLHFKDKIKSQLSTLELGLRVNPASLSL
jgi:carboxynorspermidine decarboxylase